MRIIGAGLAMGLLALGCGSSDSNSSDPEELGTTHQELCAGAAERHGDIVTGIVCPFERQSRNILVYGERTEPQLLFDASGEPIATVEASCDSWWLGVDLNGVGVLLDADAGRVLSHGTVDFGMPISELPEQLPAPFSVH